MALLFAAIVILVWAGKTNSDSTDTSATSIDTTVRADDNTKGKTDAKVVMIEYSDFQCPACALYYPVVKKLETEYADNLLIIYRHFPLKGRHANAEIAAKAAEASGKQGKFFDMHDLLFERQESWSKERDPKDLFVSYAQELGLNVEQFKTDLDSEDAKNQVDADYRDGIKGGVNATPTFFVNGEIVVNPNGYEGLKAAIDQELQNP